MTALRFTDHMLTSPGPLPDDLEAEVARRFVTAERIELGVGLGLFHGFSKMLIALGLEPDEMATTVLPTPEALGLDVAAPDWDDPHVALMRGRDDLAARWQHMASQLADVAALPRPVHERARHRLADLYGITWAGRGEDVVPPDDVIAAAVDEAAELFAIDVRALDAAVLARLRDAVGADGLVPLIMTLAVYDGIYRYAATRSQQAA